MTNDEHIEILIDAFRPLDRALEEAAEVIVEAFAGPELTALVEALEEGA